MQQEIGFLSSAQILLPCQNGVGTLKAKGVNPDRKSWSPGWGLMQWASSVPLTIMYKC
jgi:hypothetical protein